MTFTCEFCGKTLKTESGFNKHMCEKKKRFVEFNEIAFAVWLMMTNIFRIRVPKDDEQKKYAFVKSPYYNQMVSFSNWVLETRVLSLYEYLCFLKNNDVKMDSWTNSRVYHNWLYSFLLSEPEAIAIKRSKDFLDANGLNLENISSNRLYLAIKYGNISNKYLKSINCDVRSKVDESQWKEIRPLIITDVTERMNEVLSGNI